MSARKIDRQKRALDRFKILPFDQWSKRFIKDGLEKEDYLKKQYDQYVTHKEHEKRMLEKAVALRGHARPGV